MKSHRRPFELRNIKDNPDGYQIQFIVDGKSHSAFEKDLEKAKIIRDKMEKKLKIVRDGAFKKKPSLFKMSFIPGTNKPMPAGLTLRIYTRNGNETYEVSVNWKDSTGKRRIKTFYGCSETRYTLAKMRAAYKNALAFRKAYEQAVLDETLAEFDPSIFTLSNVNKKAKNEQKSLIKKLRTKSRMRKR